MAQYLRISGKTIPVQGEDGKPVQTNQFIHLLDIINESTPQHNDTDAFLCISIKEKIDNFKKGAIANADGTFNFALEASELHFLRAGLDLMRNNNKVVGSFWASIAEGMKTATNKKP